MTWNWQNPDQPHFDWDAGALSKQESQFLHEVGVIVGALKHVEEDQQSSLIIKLISNEAVETSAIEGEVINRPYVQFALRRNFGLDTDDRRIPLAEQGIADMMLIDTC